MSDLPDRFIKLGDEKWRNVKAFEFPWSLSKKGNPYVSLEENGKRFVVSVHALRERWTFSIFFEDKWHSSGAFYDDVDSAKRGALEVIGIIKRKEPVPREETTQHDDERDESDSGRDDGLNRRIRL